MTKDTLLGKETLAEKMRKVKQELNSNELSIQFPAPEQPNEMPIVKEPKLFITGRLDRKKHQYTITSVALLKKLAVEIEAYCNGGDLVILNYLIKEGLKKVKESPSPLMIDVSDIENL